ncbi:MAG: tetratricopeptide repeat protein [Alphaproteobacteria bacterium]|nr:tetratricopeptide repeat protein [Alphaproteobacteria bacterium]
MTAPSLDPRPLRHVLAGAPESAGDWLKLGLLLAARSQVPEAAVLIRRAIALAPRAAVAWESLAMAEESLADWPRAIAAWQQAVALRPGRLDSHLRLARALSRMGEADAADRSYEIAGRLAPRDVALAEERVLNLAAAGRRHGRVDAYRRALALDPTLAPAWINLGALARGEAEGAWRRATHLAPDLADAHNNLGTVEQRAGRLAAAARSYKRALLLQPDRADAWFNLGSSLQNLNRIESAVAAYERAVALRAGFVDALLPLATLLNYFGLLDRATAVNRQILAVRPDNAEANRAVLSALVFDPAIGGAGIRRIREEWCRSRLPSATPRFGHARDPERAIRVGVLGGPNLRGNTHAFVALPGFEGLDRRTHGIEVIVYSDLPAEQEDGYTKRYRLASDGWRLTEKDDDAGLARLIEEDRVDVLVDVVGHLGGPRFPAVARRPAPVQIMDLALGTSGSSAAQWILGDPLLTPAEHDAHFTETVLRLPLAYCYDPLIEMPAVGPLPAAANRHVTFGSTNALVKITPSTIRLWAKVLQAVPTSRLVVKGRGFSEPRVRRHFGDAFARAGVDLGRVELRPWTAGFVDHLTFLNEIDIALDPIPYGGVTTTCEAVWMGVPVVTVAGDRMAGRYSLALLSSVGFTEGIATDEADYVARAARLAADPEALAAVRASLRAQAQRSRLADRKAYGQARGEAFRTAWRDWCRTG